MEDNQFIELQNIIKDYFKDVDNKTLVLFMISFVYHNPTNSEIVSDLISKFLKDNGLEKAYANHIDDYIAKTSGQVRFFNKTSQSESSLIGDINHALLNLSFHRLVYLVDEISDTKPLAKPKKRHSNQAKVKFSGSLDIEKSVHLVSKINSEYTICGILINGDYSGKSETTTNKIDCDHCKTLIKQLKSFDDE